MQHHRRVVHSSHRSTDWAAVIEELRAEGPDDEDSAAELADLMAYGDDEDWERAAWLAYVSELRDRDRS